MNKTSKISFKALIGSCLCLPLFIAFAVPSETLSTPELIKALQSGGHIMYVRHGKTDVNQKDNLKDTFDDCQNQRNLSEEGREQVKKLGQIIHALKIPIGNVLASPYCRTKDTAKLAFGDFTTEQNLQFSMSKNKAEAKQLGEYLHAMMLKSEAGANNEVFVGHTANLKDGLGVWPKPEGVVAVFKKTKGELIFRGMIKPDQWLGKQSVVASSR